MSSRLALHSIQRIPRRREAGAVLVVVLILLLVMTLLGLAGTRVALNQERMGAGLYDRSLSFQAAEAALIEGEAAANQIRAGTLASPAAGTCTNGICGFPIAANAPVWAPGAATWDTARELGTLSAADAIDLGDLVPAIPRYIVERLADQVPTESCPGAIEVGVGSSECLGSVSFYRITARAGPRDGDPDDRAVVFLQSIYSN